MPVVKIHRINEGQSFGLWKLEESEEELLYAMRQDPIMELPSPDISNEIKRKEHMAGRLILKALVEENDLCYEGIYKDEVGKPHLNKHPHHISLTHSFPWVGAIISLNEPVGIDLEQPKEKLKKIAYKFLNDAELKSVGDDVEKLCIYWCAKEALYKLLGKKGIIFKLNLSLDSFEIKDETLIVGNVIVNDIHDCYSMKAVKINNTFLVYSINKF